MQLQMKPNPWSCCPTAWAMALEIPVAELIAEIGHDGSEIAFPTQPSPANRRGFHSQEMIRIAIQHNLAPVPLELFPVLCPNNRSGEGYIPVCIRHDMTNLAYFDNAIIHGKGILECMSDLGHKHAVAFERGNIFDPEGYPYSYSELKNHGLHPMKLWRLYHV